MTDVQQTCTLCTLCGSAASAGCVVDGESSFCCHGCHAVYKILSAKGEQDSFRDHPVFRQALDAGLISNPALLEEINRNKPDVPQDELKKIYFEVQEMWCPSCAEVIKLMLLREKGVKNCVVDYTTDLASVEYAPRYIGKDEIYQTIERLGYHPEPLQGAEKRAVSFSMWLRFIIAAFCTLNIMMFSYPIYATYFADDSQGYARLFAWLSLFTSLPVLTFSAWPIARRFWNSVRVGILGMETLVVIGVGASLTLSLFELFSGGVHVYFDSMTVIITLVLLGKIIEAKAKFNAKDSILQLTKSSPRRARKCFSDGSQQFVPMKEVAVGDTLAVFTGEKVVLDGEVVQGEGCCDESLMTGESLPVLKRVGSKVLGGTFLQNGSLQFRVTAEYEDTALHKIIDVVERDIGHKTSYVRAADRIVRAFVPAVVTIAFVSSFLTYYYYSGNMTEAFLRFVSILLISCPCAIGIAAPLAESYMMHGLARLGALVRNRGVLSLLGKETLFVFDKTGTITEGRFLVLDGLDSMDIRTKEYLKGLSLHSTHPIATAVACTIEALPFKWERVEEFAGKGLRGTAHGISALFGSEEFLRLQGVDTFKKSGSNTEGATPVYFSVNFSEAQELLLGDKIRLDAKDVVKLLSPTKTVLLSGDAESAVRNVAKQCDFSEYHARYNPLQKRDYIETERKRGNLIAMLGDGINDAPALTASHIGISVVSATDISIQVSDVLLTTDSLKVLHAIRTLARKGQRIINQNLFWAFFYNGLGIGLAALGYLSPIYAAGAMVLSSLIVLFNAKRLQAPSIPDSKI